MNISLPPVTLVVTSYNYEKYIIDCLESIKQQTYPHVKCVIVDDCSTDSSREKIKDFIKKNAKSRIPFCLVEQEENKGQLAGFLRGIEESDTPFVSFIDADDLLFPEYVTCHIQVHLSTNVAMTNSQQIDLDSEGYAVSFFLQVSTGTPIPRNFTIQAKSPEEFSQISSSANHFQRDFHCKVITQKDHNLFDWHWSPTTSSMFRRSVLEFFLHAEGLTTWGICADNLLFKFAHLIGGSCLIQKKLSAYRRHGENLFSSDKLIGNLRYFPEKSVDKGEEFRHSMPFSILQIFRSGKEAFIREVGKIEYHGLVRNIMYYMSYRSIVAHHKLLFQLLDIKSLKCFFLLCVKVFVKKILLNQQIKKERALQKKSRRNKNL